VLALAIGTVVVLALLHRQSSRELRERQERMEALVAGSTATSHDAVAGLAAGRFDAAAAVSSGLLVRVLDEFVGYEQVTRRGNRFRINKIASEFRNGFVEVQAESHFSWRFGLYDGPIASRYLAFARLTPDGDCFLYFRLLAAQPLGAGAILNRLLQPIVSLRMQRNLEIPDFRLPLGLRRPTEGKGFAREWQGVAVRVPARSWDLGGRRALPFAEPGRLGVLLESGETAGGEAARQIQWGEGDVEIAVRVDLLAEVLARAIQGPADITFAAGRVRNVYRPAHPLARALFTERVDLAGLSGTIDLRELTLDPIPGGLQVSLDMVGKTSGRLEGALLGLSFSVPLEVTTAMHEALPLRLVAAGSELTLTVDRDELVVPLEIEAVAGQRTLQFSRDLRIPIAALLSAVNLPGLAVTELKIPTFVERGEIRKTKLIPLSIAWQVESPPTGDGFLLARGRVRLGAEAAGAPTPPSGP
jgi:hypothetical protein